MEFSAFCSLLSQKFSANSLEEPNETAKQRFHALTEHLLRVNQTTNLTAIRTEADVIDKHYVDSALLLPYLPQGARILDLGCGPGFPTLPIAILREDLSITALDSTSKKVDFVNESAKILRLSNVCGVSGRAEDEKIRKQLGEYDFVVSRAVARLNVLCELSIPYLKIGGSLIAMKGAKGAGECAEAQNAIAILGAILAKEDVGALVTDSGSEARETIVIQKTQKTPDKYPRAYGAILKKPL